MAAYWHQFSKQLSDLTAHSPLPDLHWHEAQVDAAEEAGHWPDAARHLAPLLRARPRDSSLYQRRATALAKGGRWLEASRDFSAALQGNRSSYLAYYRLALTQLGAGNHAGYRATASGSRGSFPAIRAEP